MTRSISLFDVTPLMDHLSAGRLVLTSNQRLASRISTAYANRCVDAAKPVIKTPKVFAVNHWVEKGWQRMLITGHSLALEKKPLSLYQEQAVWEEIVTAENGASTSLGSALLRPSATAKTAASAYKLLLDWRQDLSCQQLRDEFKHSQDSEALLCWIEAFVKRCEDNHWIVQAEIAERVRLAYETGALEAEGNIIGVGFEDMPPLMSALVNSAGHFTDYDSKKPPGQVTLTSCTSTQQEITAAAVWAKKVLKNERDATVAIVVPGLSAQRQTVERVLHEVFEPEFNMPLNEQHQPTKRRNMPFNFSAGYPLLDAPIILAAVDALSLAFPVVELDVLRRICQSPFYCNDENDFDRIAVTLTRLYAQRDDKLSTARFRQILDRVLNRPVGAKDLGEEESEWEFASALQAIARLSTPSLFAKARTISDWLEVFDDILSAITWPGKRDLDSIEYQQASQWQRALEILAGQQTVLGPLLYTEVITQLRNILSQIIFQPQSSDSSLQILGTLEASGLEFSHLWLMSMSEHQWPPSPAPNPLLPYQLQRQLLMPHATAEKELQYARKLTEGFERSAAHIVVSSPEILDDTPTTISRLFAAYPTQSLKDILGRGLHDLIPRNEVRRKYVESQRLENYSAGDAPTLTKEERVKGGSSVFASQSACPFKAFLLHRLGLQSLPDVEYGLNAADRGSILHRALELLWQKLKNQRTLMAMNSDERAGICTEVSRYTLEEFCQSRSHDIGAHFQRLEIDRVEKLLSKWLDVESDRANFDVHTLEEKRQFNFGDLTLEARIDRVDRLDDGSFFIIDYKTGASSVNKWWGERPDEPQLPLYSLLADTQNDSVKGIAYAQVRAEKCLLTGVGSEDFPETSAQWNAKHQTHSGMANWEQLKQHWEKVLTTLANDFIQGKADVDPKSITHSCQYCHFSSVCRVGHQTVDTL